ncbi:response regulator [Roseomonas ludipueritiae]|uniref:histidine kinase n=2 Tax=Pseudoroseomonas ludipueritiae TaxID=198093 RepID=A0ABR7RE91_9PROT|nr:response regulator [Pseudoroseomonas ludipueritiae]
MPSWPQSLRSTVRTLLSSQYPMILTWGPSFTQIYNDAYAGLIGNKHPSALGEDIRVTMEESWDTLGPMIERVMRTGEANWTQALPLLIERSGYREEAYLSVSHAPAEDDEGRIVGMLAVCSEVTSQVVGERRLSLLHELGAAAREIRSVEASCNALAKALAGDPLDVPFALLYLRNGDAPLDRVVAVGLPTDHVAAPAALAENTETPWRAAPALAGQAVELHGLGPLLGLPGGLWADPVEDAVVLPVRGETSTEPLGVLILGLSPSRAWDDTYKAFSDLATDQISTALRNARAYEEERRRAEALAELDRAKTQFFSNVSHEFRTPLTLMLGPVEELLRRPDLDPSVRDELTLAHRNALRLLRLVNTLLDFSRVEAGRADASFERVDLSRLTAELASTFRSAIEKAGLRLEIDCPPLAGDTYVDRDMWEKIVLNLLSNAFKHTFSGHIAVALRAGQDGQARLTVSDTGVGIPPDQLHRIFDRFHRVEGSHSRTHEGSGIGLALVRELVQLHGGSVEAASQSGHGSVFTVTLPLGHAHLPAEHIGTARRLASTGIGAAPFVEEALRWVDGATPMVPAEGAAPVVKVVPLRAAARERAGPAAPRRRIVLADDNADMRAYVERLLAPLHDVASFAEGAGALAALRAQPADLLLTDVMMPVMDGFALLRAVRADPALRTTPVLLLSARAGEEASVEGLEAGADDYLVKPFSARELLARVRTHLELAALRREAEAQAHQAQKMEAVGQLTGGIAHDFNNLLGAVIGSLELVERRIGDDPRVIGLLRNAQQAAQRGVKLTGQLLAFSRRQQLQARPTNVNQAILGMGDLLHRSLGGKVGFSTHLAKDLWPAMADANQLELAVLNLAINARDAMPDGGELTIRTMNFPVHRDGVPSGPEPGDYVIIEVSDTGEGMSPEVLSRAFEPFFTTKDVGKGTGLGLAQVFGSVKQLGGDVTVESQLGIGTTVKLFLPRASAAAEAEEAQLTQAADVTRSPGGSVLLVDDDPQVRVAAADMLREMGHTVTVLENGREALRWLAGDARVDLMLADFAMPGMTGAELAARARALRPELRVLLATGYADKDGATAGDLAAAVLRKPFSLAELRKAVNIALTESRSGEPAKIAKFGQARRQENP